MASVSKGTGLLAKKEQVDVEKFGGHLQKLHGTRLGVKWSRRTRKPARISTAKAAASGRKTKTASGIVVKSQLRARAHRLRTPPTK